MAWLSTAAAFLIAKLKAEAAAKSAGQCPAKRLHRPTAPATEQACGVADAGTNVHQAKEDDTVR
jgi:hypothetical protein